MTIATQEDTAHFKEITNFHPENFPSHTNLICSDYAMMNYLSLVGQGLVSPISTAIFSVTGTFTSPVILSKKPMIFSHAYLVHDGISYNKNITDVLGIGFPNYDVDELEVIGENISHKLFSKALSHLTLDDSNGVSKYDWLNDPESHLGMNRIKMFNTLMSAFNISYAQKYGL